MGSGWSWKASWRRRELNQILRGGQDLEKTKRTFQVVSERWNQTYTYAFIHGVKVYCVRVGYTGLSVLLSRSSQLDFPSPHQASGWSGRATATLQPPGLHRGWNQHSGGPSCSSPHPTPKLLGQFQKAPRSIQVPSLLWASVFSQIK